MRVSRGFEHRNDGLIAMTYRSLRKKRHVRESSPRGGEDGLWRAMSRPSIALDARVGSWIRSGVRDKGGYPRFDRSLTIHGWKSGQHQ